MYSYEIRVPHCTLSSYISIAKPLVWTCTLLEFRDNTWCVVQLYVTIVCLSTVGVTKRATSICKYNIAVVNCTIHLLKCIISVREYPRRLPMCRNCALLLFRGGKYGRFVSVSPSIFLFNNTIVPIWDRCRINLFHYRCKRRHNNVCIYVYSLYRPISLL